MHAVRPSNSARDVLDHHAQLRAAREVLRMEAVAVWKLSTTIDHSFTHAIELVRNSAGSVIVTGMGKAGLVGQKIAATLASTGTRSHFMHPAEAFHGDLGRIAEEDVVLMLTQSGETSEVVQLLPSLRNMRVPIIAITASSESKVGRAATCVLELGDLEEACSLGLAPSTSTTAMLALGDALALVLSKLAGFAAEDFARFHPGGSLGFKLSKVDDHMRGLSECRVAEDTKTVREVIVSCSRPGRRSGAVMLVSDVGELSGIFTDSDLARLVECHDEQALDRPISEVMTKSCARVQLGARTELAIEILAERKISELPVVDHEGCPVGMIDVTDVMSSNGQQEERDDERPTIRVFPKSAPDNKRQGEVA
ncbi:KpsF/GutQ family sugar-phosphate isomerase [Aeoliella sp. ICT_H6.2]|uniref:KpsF/GutQ family sugar-phosphate isomerase n=1 Tax=Aeoliella straminimaris TaxID=2954799 RepID=A0A9X2FGM7_9BACT|nr:KpsF/GutQ family sugar-phosphate isomerase [Aeoliella straminimaris]MCO6046099.1 KpsF/GutQ family sugar-phosphate isomerase [Aeoliella straminimaris]